MRRWPWATHHSRLPSVHTVRPVVTEITATLMVVAVWTPVMPCAARWRASPAATAAGLVAAGFSGLAWCRRLLVHGGRAGYRGE
jgi:hypothetical protein